MMHALKRLALLPALASLLLFAGTGIAGETLTMSQAVAAALDSRPETKKFKHKAKALAAKSKAATKPPEPMLGADTGIPFTDPLAFPEVSVVISQSFPLSKKLSHAGEVFEKQKDSMKWLENASALDITYQTQMQYIRIAALEEELKVLEDIETLALQVVDAANVSVASGKGDAAMAARAQVEVEEIRSEINKLTQSLEPEKTRLAVITGLEPWQVLESAFVLPAVETVDVELIKTFDEALAQSPEIKFLDEQVSAGFAKKKVALDSYYPMMTISAGYKYKSDKLAGLMGKDAFTIAAGITIPIWTKHYKAALDAEDEEIASLGLAKEELAIKVKNNVASAYAQLKSLQSQYADLNQSIIPQIKLAYELQITSFSSSGGSLTDVLDPLRKVSEALRKKVVLEAKHAQARAAFERALGTINEQGGSS